MTHPATSEELIRAAEVVICRARDASEITSRAIATEAGVNLSAIGYHFGTLDALVARVGQRVYQRLNTERLNLLQQAVDRHHPRPPPVAAVIKALIAPSIRWSRDPASAYGVFTFMHHRSTLSPTPDLFRPIEDQVNHHRAFITVLRRCTPWLSEPEIGWRLNAVLGIRSQVNRQPRRAEVLSDFSVNLADAEAVIAAVVEIVEPMFARPATGTALPRRAAGPVRSLT